MRVLVVDLDFWRLKLIRKNFETFFKTYNWKIKVLLSNQTLKNIFLLTPQFPHENNLNYAYFYTFT
jgi:hypothetical protein